MVECWSYGKWYILIVRSTVPLVDHSVVKVCILAISYRLTPSFVETFSKLKRLTCMSQLTVNLKFLNENSFAVITCEWGLVRICQQHPLQWIRPPPHKNGGPGYDTELHLVVRLLFWNFGVCGITCYYYSHVQSDLLESLLWVK